MSPSRETNNIINIYNNRYIKMIDSYMSKLILWLQNLYNKATNIPMIWNILII